MSTLPAGWSAQDIGATSGGSSSYLGTTFSQIGTGAGIGIGGGGSSSDAIQFAYKLLMNGDATITGRLGPGTQFSTFGGFGIMFRAGLGAQDKCFCWDVSGGSLGTISTGVLGRSTSGAAAANLSSGPLLPELEWYRIVRTGNVFTAFYSHDGINWTQQGGSFLIPFSLAAGLPLYAGIFIFNQGPFIGQWDNVSIIGDPFLAPVTDPQIILRCSNDGGETWGNERPVSMGKLGAYSTLVRWRQLGRSNNRVFEVICSEPVQVALIEADLDSQGN